MDIGTNKSVRSCIEKFRSEKESTSGLRPGEKYRQSNADDQEEEKTFSVSPEVSAGPTDPHSLNHQRQLASISRPLELKICTQLVCLHLQGLPMVFRSRQSVSDNLSASGRLCPRTR